MNEHRSISRDENAHEPYETLLESGVVLRIEQPDPKRVARGEKLLASLKTSTVPKAVLSQAGSIAHFISLPFIVDGCKDHDERRAFRNSLSPDARIIFEANAQRGNARGVVSVIEALPHLYPNAPKALAALAERAAALRTRNETYDALTEKERYALVRDMQTLALETLEVLARATPTDQ